MINMVEFNKKRIASGKAPEKQTLRSLYGKPWYREDHGGRLLGQVLFDGVSSQGRNSVSWKQRSRSGSLQILRTAEQTQALLEKARGHPLY